LLLIALTWIVFFNRSFLSGNYTFRNRFSPQAFEFQISTLSFAKRMEEIVRLGIKLNTCVWSSGIAQGWRKWRHSHPTFQSTSSENSWPAGAVATKTKAARPTSHSAATGCSWSRTTPWSRTAEGQSSRSYQGCACPWKHRCHLFEKDWEAGRADTQTPEAATCAPECLVDVDAVVVVAVVVVVVVSYGEGGAVWP